VRRDVIPQAAVLEGFLREVEPALYGDGHTDHEDDDERPQKEAALLEENYDSFKEIHDYSPRKTGSKGRGRGSNNLKIALHK